MRVSNTTKKIISNYTHENVGVCLSNSRYFAVESGSGKTSYHMLPAKYHLEKVYTILAKIVVESATSVVLVVRVVRQRSHSWFSLKRNPSHDCHRDNTGTTMESQPLWELRKKQSCFDAAAGVATSKRAWASMRSQLFLPYNKTISAFPCNLRQFVASR